MIKRLRCLCAMLSLLAFGCKKPYNPPAINSAVSYLVVEGTINAAPDSTIIKISRTVNLSNKITSNPVEGAAVTIESSNNDIFPLNPAAPGVYKIYGLDLSSSFQYRLRIKSGADEYLSDFVPVLNSPPLDSVNYLITNGGLTICANTHDPTNTVKYFRWECDETWVFHSNYNSYYYSNGDTVLSRNLIDQIYTCWRNDTVSNIGLGSTARLSNSVIVNAPLTSIASTSQKLSVEYSIQVKQHALTADAYAFWQNLKKNTEQLGSIFDAQPSQINGNIHCVNDPGQAVIGFVSAGATSARRIFIHNQQLPDWPILPTDPDCQLDSLLYKYTGPGGMSPPVNQIDEYINYNKGAVDPLIPVTTISKPGQGIVGYTASTPQCVDCTLTGTTKRPSFWQ